MLFLLSQTVRLTMLFSLATFILSCGQVIPKNINEDDTAFLHKLLLGSSSSSLLVSFEGSLVKNPEAIPSLLPAQVYRFTVNKVTGVSIDSTQNVSVYVCAANCSGVLRQTSSTLTSVTVNSRLGFVNAVRVSSTSLLFYNPTMILAGAESTPPNPTPTAVPSTTPLPSPTATPIATPPPAATATPSATAVPSATTTPTVTSVPVATATPLASSVPSATTSPVPPSAGAASVFLVVNSASTSSMDIAQHYISLRGIPSNNVLNLNFTGNRVTTDVNTFRTQILTPILSAISQRGLESVINYIVYSSDFPPVIDYSADVALQGSSIYDKYPFASLTGLTFLQHEVLAKNKNGYHATRSNPYYSITNSIPFSKSYSGKRYYLSLMLGVTTGNAGVDVNTVTEVRNYLSRARSADGTNPSGKVYFRCAPGNTEIRCRIRESQPAPAAAALTALGVSSEIANKTSTFEEMPKNAPNVIGAFLGTATLFITDKDAGPGTGSYPQLLPGAITEHLTSHGAAFTLNEQSKITQWFRLGAAGSSGTVAEPIPSNLITQADIAAKFPHAYMHVHYARGFTLGEAFYQAVSNPFQLLIVGDPLCKPWNR